MMSRKDYEKVAAMINAHMKSADKPASRTPYFDMMSEMAAIFREDNPKFNSGVFCAACLKDVNTLREFA